MTFGSDIGTQIDAELARVTTQLQANLTAKQAQWDAEKADLLAQIDELSKPAPAPTPPQAVATTRFGAGGGNTDRSKQTGVKIDRRYYGVSDATKAVADVKRNAAAGVLTWMSFKMPNIWADMVAGKGDAWAKDIIAKLDALNTEVWLAFHHEPEGDGVMTDWTKLQDRLSRFVPSSSKVKYWLITTGWHQTKGTTAAYKWPALYPKGAPIYGIAYDYPYQSYGNTTKNGVTTFNNAWTDPNYYIDAVAADAASLSTSEKRKIEAGCAEWGYGDEAFTKDKTWAQKVMQRAIDKKLLGCTYFDTTLNSSHSWYLGAASAPKRIYVEGLMKGFNP